MTQDSHHALSDALELHTPETLLTVVEDETKSDPDPDLRVYDDKGRSIAWQLKDTYRLYASRTQHILSRRDVTIGHWFYLRILSEHDGLSQQELSRRVGIHPNTAVPALDNMEKQGLVTRTRDPKDRRKFCIHLTEKGRGFRDEMAPAIKALLLRSVEGISNEELSVFFNVLEKIWNNLLAEESVGVDSWAW